MLRYSHSLVNDLLFSAFLVINIFGAQEDFVRQLHWCITFGVPSVHCCKIGMRLFSSNAWLTRRPDAFAKVSWKWLFSRMKTFVDCYVDEQTSVFWSLIYFLSISLVCFLYTIAICFARTCDCNYNTLLCVFSSFFMNLIFLKHWF
jgi:hypothetical protein